jgi:hypothetical protein
MVQGRLKLQENKRYAIYHELTSGDRVEVYDGGEWIETYVECGKDGYYLTNGSDIDGALVRIK